MNSLHTNGDMVKKSPPSSFVFFELILSSINECRPYVPVAFFPRLSYFHHFRITNLPARAGRIILLSYQKKFFLMAPSIF